MKCSEVPLEPLLQFIAKVQSGETFWYPDEGQKAFYGDKVAYHTACAFYGFENSIYHAVPKGVSPLGVIKIAIKKGLVDGCTCGCRGDFELTDKGKELIGIKLEKEQELENPFNNYWRAVVK